jgi:2-polyprenyl-3-methyl-5-hydroxy-6-metoxy-1,4-benzoquinol methylase
MKKNIDDVRLFWDKNPLWSGESKFSTGTKEFFDEHRQVCIKDGFAGSLDERIFPTEALDGKILDLGCGVGFWLIEFAERGFQHIYGADLSPNSLALARKRCELYGVSADLSEENAEHTTYSDGYFDHVNCLGVIHHTPSPESAIGEISRILRPDGSATISVYYKNVALRAWPIFRPFAKLLFYLGAKLSGRGRENIFAQDSVDELTRLYDGADNPIGKAYTKQEFYKMLESCFIVNDICFHFFPARSLPFPIPLMLHRLLNRYFPFMVYATLRKPV